MTITAPTSTGDVGVDQASTIASQIAAAPNGTSSAWTYVQFPTGEATDYYRALAKISVVGKRYMVIEGPSTVDKARLHRTAENNQRHIELRRCKRVLVRNLSVTSVNPVRADGDYSGYATRTRVPDGGDPGNESEVAFTVAGCVNTEIRDCKASLVHSYGASLTSDAAPTTHSAVRRLRVDRCGGWGVAAVWAEDCEVDGLDYDKSAWGAVDLEPNSDLEQVVRLTFSDMTIDTYGFGVISHQNAHIEDITVEDVTVSRVTPSWGVVDFSMADNTDQAKRGWKRGLTVRRISHTWHATYAPSFVQGTWLAPVATRNVEDVLIEDCDFVVKDSGVAAGSYVATVAYLCPPGPDGAGTVVASGNDGQGAEGGVLRYFSGGAQQSDHPTYTTSGNRWGAALELGD